MSGRGVDQKGRSKKDASHVRFYEFELRSAAFRSLSVGARALLIELKSLYNGKNNGELFLSTRDAATRLNADKSAPTEWFWELRDRGFIRPKVEAGFNWKTAARARMATCWILTEYATDDAAPTRDFQHWTGPPKPRPKNIRRSDIAGSLPVMAGSLPVTAGSDAQSARLDRQIRPIQPENVTNLPVIPDTDSYQVKAVGKPRGAEPPHSEAQRHAAGAPQRIHLACQMDTPGAAAAGPCRDETPSASPESPSKVVKITRGKISAANRA